MGLGRGSDIGVLNGKRSEQMARSLLLLLPDPPSMLISKGGSKRASMGSGLASAGATTWETVERKKVDPRLAPPFLSPPFLFL